MGRVYFVTGTDTGVGKTVLTVLLIRHLRRSGVAVSAVKPLSSGTRADARFLATALGSGSTLESINPWHFQAPLAPAIAARRSGGSIPMASVIHFLRDASRKADALVVEGAGGLLSPLGPDFDARDLIRATKAIPIVVAANRLGAINGTLLTLEALGSPGADARIALVAPKRATLVSRSNEAYLRARCKPLPVVAIPWLRDPMTGLLTVTLRRALDVILNGNGEI